ncbi:MAG: ATP-binding protein [Lentisphaerae bacterium]|nr:ATP-binding protein [Lentisphaerota bacterium]
MTPYLQRELKTSVVSALRSMPVVIVTGLRQSGKSTFLLRDAALRGRRYVSLDDYAALEAARRDPDALLDQGAAITIDEAQKCPDLLMAVKRAVERDRTPGRFLLSGSANFALLKGASDSLAGRAIYLTLHPLSLRELHGRIEQRPFIPDFFEHPRRCERLSGLPVNLEKMRLGGLPPVVLGEPQQAALWFKGYEQTYLERDLREFTRVSDVLAFRALLRLAALRTGQLMNISDLARDARLNTATASRYLGYLELSFLIHRLPPYLSNRASRLIKSPKLYMADAGLASYLAGVASWRADADEPMRGALLETYVAGQLISILETRMPDARLHFWNIQGRHEVDFVIEKGRSALAIEVKAAAQWRERDLSGLKALLATTPQCRAGILAYLGKETVSLGARLWAVPLGVLLS